MDVFVLLSRYEGLPVVGIESQAAGLPCIFSNRMTRETETTKNVVFMDINSILPWVDKILDRKEKRTSCQECMEDFDIFRQASKLETYYCECLKDYKGKGTKNS